MQAGQLAYAGQATVGVAADTIDLGGGVTAGASRVTVNYPFEFMVLQPVARLLSGSSNLGTPFTMTATAVMRNE
jgi:hypothetical protein